MIKINTYAALAKMFEDGTLDGYFLWVDNDECRLDKVGGDPEYEFCGGGECDYTDTLDALGIEWEGV